MGKQVKFAVVLLIMILVVGVSDLAAQQGVVSIFSVGEQTRVGGVKAGQNVTFTIRYNNDAGMKVDISNGFRLSSPDGATWDSTTIATSGAWGDGKYQFAQYFNIVYKLLKYSCDGQGKDTVAVLGAGDPSDADYQLPVGYIDDPLKITAWFHNSDAVGKSICIDSSFYRPGGTWKWVHFDEEGTEHDFYPAFVGPTGVVYQAGYGFCFQIEQEAGARGVVALEKVSSLKHDLSINAGQKMRMLIRYTNDVGKKVSVCNGFKLSSPDGAVWDSLTIDSLGYQATGHSPFMAYFDLAKGLRTLAADSVGAAHAVFLGAGTVGQEEFGLPIGFSDTLFAMTAWFHDQSAVGKHICIDSAFFPPGGQWKWVDEELIVHIPVFRGLAGQPYSDGNPTTRLGSGYCFAIEEPVVYRVINVPADYATIQAAIDASTAGDTIVVAPGTYPENLNLKGKAVCLKSSGGSASTFIVPTSGEAVITCSTGEDTTTVIQGFTIDGNMSRRGITCSGASPIIEYCDIKNCVSYRDGGGVYCYNSSAKVRHNRLYNNRADATGGGVCVQGTSVRGIEICYNEIWATQGCAEAVGCLYAVNVNIHHNLLRNNATDCWAASGVYINGGGGSANIRIVNNTIVGNSHGIVTANDPQPLVRNNIIVSNTGTGIPSYFTNSDYNDVWNNGSDNNPGEHGISVDPLFWNPSVNNYTLQAESPCFMTGDPDPIYNEYGDRANIGAFGITQADSLVIYVPDDYATIPEAVSAAVNGELILVRAGVYTGTITITGKSVQIKSVSGPLSTIITADDGTDLVVFKGTAASESILEGFTLSGGRYGIWCQNSGPTIKRNILTGQHCYDWAAVALSGDGYGSQGNSPAKLINNTIVHSENGGISMFNLTQPATIKNTIVAFNAGYGIHLQDTEYAQPIMSYNDIYGNPVATYNITSLGTGTIALDPKLAADNTLFAGSPCIGAGDPDPAYNDPDGTRNDMGAVPGTTPPPTGRTINVPAEYATIQAAINAAINGDTVLVAPGTYSEHIDLKGKAILLTSSGGRDATVIKAVYEGTPVVMISHGEDTTTVINGFGIDGSGFSRGISCLSTSPIIQYCDIRNCAAYDGAGIYCYASSAKIRNNRMHHNNVTQTGGGVCAEQSGVRDIEICYNEVSNTTGSGEGLGCLYASNVYIHHNIIRNNVVNYWAASGIYMNAGGNNVRIVNNTIVGNTRGMVTYASPQPLLRNNIIVSNQLEGLPSHFTNSDYNDVWGNGSNNIPGIHGISVNPLFVDATDLNFNLQAGSPCINAGDPDVMYSDPDGTRNDMGALYYNGSGGLPEVIPTNEWILVYCQAPTLDGVPLVGGTIIEAYDPAGVLCGRATVKQDGTYGLMPIYRDDSYTSADEGAVPGDLITFKINGVTVVSQPPVYWTANGDRFATCQFLAQRCQQITLNAGWNLISWNVAYSGKIEECLSSVIDKVDLVLGFDRGALAYDPKLVPFSTLLNVDYSHGYWVKMNSGATITICGGDIGIMSAIPVYKGWNLVSYWPDAAWSVPKALFTVMDKVQVVIGYEHGAQTYIPGQDAFNTLTQMKPGFGYWIRSTGVDYLDYFFMPVAPENRNVGSSAQAAAGAGSGIASRDWMLVYAEKLTVDGEAVPDDATIEAFTSDGILVGQSVYSGGMLKFTPVYGYSDDDPQAARYPKDGDQVYISVNGVKTTPAIEWHGSGEVVELGALNKPTQLPGQYTLHQNYPNPFNPETKIAFDLPKASAVKLVIYNLLGQKIRTLAEGAYPAGQHELVWDGNTDGGEQVASGVYLYRLEADNFTASKKMLLVK